ncbi:MAG: hypothetical protein M1825_004223 [Sarcosagium campestre]|nr:MAG: hypothetical protein M1825_004223 [Sarcosagium campestre]
MGESRPAQGTPPGKRKRRRIIGVAPPQKTPPPSAEPSTEVTPQFYNDVDVRLELMPPLSQPTHDKTADDGDYSADKSASSRSQADTSESQDQTADDGDYAADKSASSRSQADTSASQMQQQRQEEGERPIYSRVRPKLLTRAPVNRPTITREALERLDADNRLFDEFLNLDQGEDDPKAKKTQDSRRLQEPDMKLRLKQFARRGGPDLGNVVGVSESLFSLPTSHSPLFCLWSIPF